MWIATFNPHKNYTKQLNGCASVEALGATYHSEADKPFELHCTTPEAAQRARELGFTVREA